MIPWETVDENLQTKWTALQSIFIKDGRNVTIEMLRRLVSSTDLKLLVEILDEQDRSLLYWALKGRNESREVIQALLDDDNDNLLIPDVMEGKLPIHVAVERQSPVNVIELLLEVNVSIRGDKLCLPIQCRSDEDFEAVEVVDVLLPTNSCDTINRTILEQDAIGRLPLHAAVENNASVAVVKVLLRADFTHQTVCIPDDEGNLPIHIALREGASAEVIQLLLEADVEKKTVCLRVVRLLLKRYPQKQDWVDNYMAGPLLRILLEKPQEPIKRDKGRHDFQLSIRSSSFDAEFRSFDAPSGVPVAVYPMLAKTIAKSRGLQRLVNEHSADRKVVAVFLEDLYANCFLIATYLIATNDFLSGRDSGYLYFVPLFFLAIYFLIREVVQVTFHQEQYLFNMWNFFDICRIVLVLASASYMRARQSAMTIDEMDPDPQAEPAGHTLLAWTGAVVFLGMISFLRATVLSFSYFVHGVFNIFIKLLPFFVGTALVLTTFAYVYFVDRYYFVDIVNNTCVPNDDEGVPANFCSLEDAFYAVYGYLISGPEETSTPLDLIFGIVMIIVLLNVLIAIVTAEWERSSEHVAEDFWLHRISFLTEGRLLLEWLDKVLFVRIQPLFDSIDSYGEKRFFDRIPWEEKPYRFVWLNRKYYYNPESLQFDPCYDEQTIRKWRAKLKSINSYEADWKFAPDRSSRRKVLMRSLGCILVYICGIIPLGLVTFGYLWPRRFRMFLFGHSKTKERQNTLRKEVEGLKKEMNRESRERKEEMQEIRELLTKLVRSSCSGGEEKIIETVQSTH